MSVRPTRGPSGSRTTRDALQESEERFRLLVENSLDEFFLHDEQGRFLDVNRRACESTGYSREEFLAMTVFDLTVGIPAEASDQLWREMAPGTSATLRAEVRRKDGSTFTAEVRVSCHLVSHRRVFLGMARDITDRVRAEEAIHRLNAELEERIAEQTRELRHTADTLQAVMDGAMDAIVLTDHDGRYLMLNRAAEQTFGRPAADVIGKTSVEIFGAAVGGAMRAREARVLASGEPETTDEVHVVQDVECIFQTTRSPRRDGHDRVTGLVCIARDVTARRRAERDALVDRERLSLATRVSRLGVWDYDIGANRLYCDDRWYEILGRDPSSPVQRIEDFRPWIHPDDVERATDVNPDDLATLMSEGRGYGIVFRIVRPDGEIRWVRSAACLIATGAGTPGRAVGVVADITESREAEERLRQSYLSLIRAEAVARVGSWTLDLATEQFTCSDMLYEMVGIDPQVGPLPLSGLTELLSPDDHRRTRSAFDACAQTGEPFAIDVRQVRYDGVSFVAHVRGRANRDEAGVIVGIAGTVQDITEREEARARLTALADHLPSGAIFHIEPDRRGRHVPTYVSAGLESLIGISASRLLEDPACFVRAVHEDDVAQYRAAARRAFRTGTALDSRFRVRTSDGRIVWLHVRAVPRVQGSGTVIFDGIIRDVTAEREVAEALEQAKAAAEAAERAKGDFLATMSHEIRQPMNTMLGLMALLLRTDLTAIQRDYLTKLDASSKALLGILNDTLDFSKIEAGRLELADADFTLESVLEHVSTATALHADEKGLELVYRLSPALPWSLRGDSLRLTQVLVNLVGNAVKFTDSGEVVVSVEPVDVGDQPMLRFTVSDTGIGLGPEELANLFQPFAQAGARTFHRYGGTGLGLSISKRLVEAMGGTVGVESTAGHGSRFWFTIPSKPSPDLDESSLRVDLAGRRLLVVDDHREARRVVVDLLHASGLQAVAAASGTEAVSLLQASGPFDAVLVDWRVQAADGVDLIRWIRGLGDPSPVVLMVPGHRREEYAQLSKAGSRAVVAKPVLKSRLLAALREATATDGTLEPPHVQAARLDDDVVRALAGRRVLIVDDNPLSREIAGDILGAAGMAIAMAGDGLEALRRLEEQDFDVVLMDLQMPRMDGIEAVQAIRRQPRWAEMPVVALTAQARREDRARCIAAGMTAYLSKPASDDALYRTLADVLTGSASS